MDHIISSAAKQLNRVRAVRLGPPGMIFERRSDGCFIARNPHPLDRYPEKITDRLVHWARAAPDRVFLAQRRGDQTWRTIRYAEFQANVRAIGQALLSRGLSVERPIVVLSGNDIEHALLMYAAMLVGIPYAPISPAYSLAVKEFSRLRGIVELLQPGMIFTDRLDVFGNALRAVSFCGAELVTSGDPSPLRATPFEVLSRAQATAAVDRANAAVNADTIAKILFTSGSTGVPKGVINTQRMLSSNQAMILSVLPCLADEPPLTVDWLPWHHTFGGNHNLGLILYNGGTLYIDEGRPLPGRFNATVKNLREIAPTIYFNVPRGYQELIAALRRDEELRQRFFNRIQVIFFAAASLSQTARNDLERLALETCGERIPMVSGFGSTETAPSSLCPVLQSGCSGYIGVPEPGVELKLVPSGNKLEARVRGPHVTPGYWKHNEMTAAAFDEEGFYRTGDALALLDRDHPEKGFIFDGRLAEDFKLSTGTWVSTGELRTSLVAHFCPYVQDAAITGHDRSEVGALIFPDYEACRRHARLPRGASDSEIASHSRVRALFRELLESFAAQSTGSSNRLTRILLMVSGPSLEAGEITDKGSLNQRLVLSHRAELVERLYEVHPPDRVIALHAACPDTEKQSGQ